VEYRDPVVFIGISGDSWCVCVCVVTVLVNDYLVWWW